jgi:hypothetical protein
MAKDKPQKQPLPPVQAWAPAVALAWLVPGGGHFLLKRSGRGALILLAPGRVVFLQKPFSPEMLDGILRRMLGEQEEDV